MSAYSTSSPPPGLVFAPVKVEIVAYDGIVLRNEPTLFLYSVSIHRGRYILSGVPRNKTLIRKHKQQIPTLSRSFPSALCLENKTMVFQKNTIRPKRTSPSYPYFRYHPPSPIKRCKIIVIFHVPTPLQNIWTRPTDTFIFASLRLYFPKGSSRLPSSTNSRTPNNYST